MKANAIFVVAAVLTMATARADVMFTDRTLFATTVAGLSPITENWGELPDGTILTSFKGISYSTSFGDPVITTSAFTCNMCIEGLGAVDGVSRIWPDAYFNPTEAVTFDFSSPTSIFGIDINTFQMGADYTLFTNGGSMATSGFDAFPCCSTGEFVGLIASVPFTEAIILPGSLNTSTYTLNNLTYNIALGSVPEPSSMLLLFTVIATGAFVFARRLRVG